MKEENYLFVTNNALSYNCANGKFILNYFQFLKPNQIFNFSIRDETDSCFNNFQISDKNVLKIFFSFGIHKFFCNKNTNNVNNKTMVSYNNKKSSLKQLLRNLVWCCSFWETRQFKKWVKKCAPKFVVLYLGDFPYLFKVAAKISKKFGSKLLVVTGENYCFKENDYMKRCFSVSLFYKIFHRYLYKETKSIIQKCDLLILNSPQLLELYNSKIKCKKSIYLYPQSIKNKSNKKIENGKTILYAGNLGIERYKSLITFAKVLSEFDNEYKIKIYGNINDEILSSLKNLSNVIYCGKVNDADLTKAINKATFMLHVEAFDDYSKVDLMYAFSTKIAESLMLSKPLISFAPPEIISTSYLMSYNPDLTFTSEEDLIKNIKKINSFKGYNEEQLHNFINNHCSTLNSSKLKLLIEEL